MEKKHQLKELLELKELNKKTFNYLGYEIRNILIENKDGSMNLQFRLLKKPKTLLQHLEPSMNICYGSLEERNVRNLKEYKECKNIALKIINSWKEIDVDAIIHEANLYIKSNINAENFAYISIDNDLQTGNYQFEIIKSTGSQKLIIKEKDKGTVYKIALIEMLGKDFINLGYINYDQLRKIVFEKASKFKTKRIILKVKGPKAYKWFYFDKTNYYKIVDNSKSSYKQARTLTNFNFFNKTIMIIGVGAIGSHVAELIASFWPKKMLLWDHDISVASSSTRQNYNSLNEPLFKSMLLKWRLQKYKGVNVIDENRNFIELKSSQIHKKFDYIIDCTGEGIIAREFKEISKYTTTKTIIASAYIQKKLFTKICNFKRLMEDGVNKKWHKYDIINNKKNKAKMIIKGCSEILEYSYLDVYLIATKFVSNILKYKGEDYAFEEINPLR